MGILNKIKTKLKLAKSKVRGRKYTYLQKPVIDMTYEEVCKELDKKEKVIFRLNNSLKLNGSFNFFESLNYFNKSLTKSVNYFSKDLKNGIEDGENNNFEGRNYELLKKYLIENKDENFKIDYLVKILNNANIPKSVKVDFLGKFINLYQENELLRLLNMEPTIIDDNTKRHIVRLCVESLPEDILLQYYDYTYIEIDYLRKLLKRISVSGKIQVLNSLNNKKIQEKLFFEEVGNLDFDYAKQLYENVILCRYEDIEKFYIDKIRTCNSENVYKIVNQIEYISPNIAKEFDKLIEHKNADEVIEYINSNDVKKGGVIYLNRKFSLEDKKKVFYGLNREEDRKNALAIFNSWGRSTWVAITKVLRFRELRAMLST